MLIGRGVERAHLEALLADARQDRRGAALVLRGEPGIGKTALLRYAEEQADGFLVLRALGVESESELAYAALHELLLPLLHRLDDLPTVQARALRQGFAMAEGETVAAFAASLATFNLLADAASLQPVLCLVDDAQWIDSPSAGAISFAARRLQHDPVVVLFASREPEQHGFEAAGLSSLMVSGLHREAAAALLDQTSELAAELRARVLDVASGNPLALLELPMALHRAPGHVEAADPTPMPVSQRLERAFRGKVKALSAAGQQAALVLAAADTADSAVLRAALTELDLGRGALEEVEAAGMAEIADGRITLAHPLVRSAIYQSAQPADRRRAHNALAAGLRRQGDEELFAWHRAAAATSPDEDVAGALEATAGRARARGGASAEARALERAARLTPQPERRARRLVAAARAARRAGRAAEAEVLIADAMSTPHDGRTWAEAQAILADIEYWFGRDEWVLRMVDEVDRLIQLDRGAAVEVLVTAAMTNGPHDLEAALALSDRALLLDPEHGVAASGRAEYLSRLGRSDEAVRVALDVGTAAASRGDWYSSSEIAVVLGALERYDDAHRFAVEAMAELRAAGALKQLSHALCAFTQIETRRGNLDVAHEAGLRSLDLAQAIGEPLQVAFSASFVAACESWLGLDQAVREHAAMAMAALPGETVRTTLESRAALGLLELQLGHAEQAVAELEPVVRAVRALGIANPGYVQAGPEYVEALIRSGRPDEAATALSELERQARTSSRRWALAAVARCRGLLAPDDGFDAPFREALSLHADAGRPLETARTELAYGERLRRASRRLDARHQLRNAVATFERSGARLFAERAHRELAATGERLRRRRDAREHLSAQELQVAAVVARGSSNREAAAELFLSPKTIEFHLRNVYQKLGIKSRTQLVHALAGKGAADRSPHAGLAAPTRKWASRKTSSPASATASDTRTAGRSSRP